VKDRTITITIPSWSVLGRPKRTFSLISFDCMVHAEESEWNESLSKRSSIIHDIRYCNRRIGKIKETFDEIENRDLKLIQCNNRLLQIQLRLRVKALH